MAGYEAAVTEAVGRIRDGELEKVVLARTLEVEAGRPLDAKRLLHRLRAVEPHGYAFAAPIRDGASLVGASPELLVSLRGGEVRATPLAGTAPRAGDPDEDRANARRPRRVGEEPRGARDRRRGGRGGPGSAAASRSSWDPEPVLLETAERVAPGDSVRRPAARPVGDRARARGRAAPDARRVRHADRRRARRDRRARAVRPGRATRARWGGSTRAGDGEWAIALRCAELSGERATLFAGAGIVAGSRARVAEVDETDRKFRAFLDSLRWG